MTQGLEAINQNEYVKALECFERARDVSPADSMVYNNLASAHFHLGNVEAAKEALSKSLEIDPSNQLAVKNLEGLEQAIRKKLAKVTKPKR
jgi:Flp pilus assembly protein TadD